MRIKRDSKGRFIKGNKIRLGKANPKAAKNPQVFKKGQIPWNKGKECSWVTERNLKDNPMKKDYTCKKQSENKKGKHFSKETEFKKGQIGEKCINWKGGKSFEPYDKTFNIKFKRAIRKRDNQVCMLCGIHREKLKRALDVHHVNYNKLLSIPQNCISLCHSCHVKTNWNRKRWTYFFQSLLGEKYNYKYTNGEVVLELQNE